MITVLHRGGYAQMITILHRGGGVSRDPQKWLRNMCTTPYWQCQTYWGRRSVDSDYISIFVPWNPILVKSSSQKKRLWSPLCLSDDVLDHLFKSLFYWGWPFGQLNIAFCESKVLRIPYFLEEVLFLLAVFWFRVERKGVFICGQRQRFGSKSYFPGGWPWN